MSLRCLIADDNTRFREEARGLLEEQGIEIVDTAASAADAIAQIQALAPDVVLIDIDLRGESGFDLARTLEDLSNGSPLLILISTHDPQEYADLISASPAVGFLAKSDLSAAAIQRLLPAGTRSSDERRET